ncbi:MAG: DUF1963 domain-containing protein, partial [Planctomycetota bacterium]
GCPMGRVDEAFLELRSHFREPIVAEIGGFRPPTEPTASWLGAGCWRHGDEVPQDEGRAMFPLLQINCEELPRAVEAFGDAKLVVVYFSATRMPFRKSHGDGWLIREYDDLAGLVRCDVRPPSPIKPMPVRWSIGETECPSWEQSWELMDMTPINECEDAFEEFHELPHHGATKIGGFPTEVQHIVDHPSDFVFQVGSEPKANLNWIDAGVVYFSKKPHEDWEFDVQFC